MYIGIVLSAPPAFSETFIKSLISELAVKHRIDILCDTNIPNRNAEELSGRIFFSVLGKNVGLLQRISVLKRCMFRFEFWSFVFKILRKDFRLDSVRTIMRNAHFFCGKYDRIYFAFAPTILGRKTILETLRVKVILSFRGQGLTVLPGKRGDLQLYRDYLKLTHRIHCVSNSLKSILTATHDVNADEITVIYPALDVSRYDMDRKDSGKVRITLISRLHWLKGIHYVIRAIHLLPEEYKEGISVQIYGEGEEREHLQFLINFYNLSTVVQLLSKVAHTKVPKILSNTDIFINYSLQEGFANTVLEAQAAGCVCIVSKVGGLIENVQDKKTGYVIDAADSVLLKNQILEVINLSKAERLEMSHRARTRAQLFSIQDQMLQFNSLFNG